VRSYAGTLLVATVAFLGIGIVDQRDYFLRTWGFRSDARPADAEGLRAEGAVRAFLAALQAAYRTSTAAPLEPVALAPGLRQEIAAELAHPAAHGGSAGLALTSLDVLRVEPLPRSGFEVTTDETWTSPAGRDSRIRYRYRVGQDLRIDEMTPLLPEPVR
jgi:hypothetical protein